MEQQPLGRSRQLLDFGTPLPFGALDAPGRLLLARGRVIDDHEQLEALPERGAFVDRAAIDDPAARGHRASTEASARCDRYNAILIVSVRSHSF